MDHPASLVVVVAWAASAFLRDAFEAVISQGTVERHVYVGREMRQHQSFRNHSYPIDIHGVGKWHEVAVVPDLELRL
jgi:hypothetical protein